MGADVARPQFVLDKGLVRLGIEVPEIHHDRQIGELGGFQSSFH